MKLSQLFAQLSVLEEKIEQNFDQVRHHKEQLLKAQEESKTLQQNKTQLFDELAKMHGIEPSESKDTTLCVPKRFCADRQEFRRRLDGLMHVLDSEPNVFRSSEEIISKAIHMLHLNPACHTTRESLLHQLTRLGKEGYIDRDRPHVNAQYVYKPKALGA